jgi:HEPN domain-containing protein
MSRFPEIIKEGRHYAVCEYAEEYGLLALQDTYSIKIRSYPKTSTGLNEALRELDWKEEVYWLAKGRRSP